MINSKHETRTHAHMYIHTYGETSHCNIGSYMYCGVPSEASCTFPYNIAEWSPLHENTRGTILEQVYTTVGTYVYWLNPGLR